MTNSPLPPYIAPAIRSKLLYLEKTILSNTEPIGGKDDPDHDW
jgi:hypothetical protein